MLEIDRNPAPRVLRLFGAVWTPLALFLLAVSLHRRGVASSSTLVSLGAVAAVSVALGLFAPASLRLVYVALSYLTAPLGWVVSRVSLAVIYYCVLTPVGLVLRFLGRDALGLRSERATYWTKRAPERDVERNFRQY